jgi:serine/threonine protein kinase/Tol biopolymer transport system component
MPSVPATLAPGTRIGPYEITTLIGKGGMGEVYAASDTQLRRKVAIKVLPASVARDAGRVARLRREAQLLAALDQPGIARVHGLETSDGLTAVVMELVEGEPLDDRLARGPLPLGDALEIARQIAEALGAAHEQGIVHRDLKPGNVVVRADGRVKLLDFGLAKAMADRDDEADSQLSTVESPLTGAGVVLGTAPYMSPEQARGKPVDQRADIWAFGCLLYEMLAGRRAFPGETASDTISSILVGPPDWSALPISTAAFVPILRRCLEKDPAGRLRDIGDVQLWLDEAAQAPATSSVPPPPSRRLEWLVAAVIGLAAGGLLAWQLARSPSETRRRVARFELASIQAGTLAPPIFRSGVAISTDGTQIAYTAMSKGRSQLFIRRLDQPVALPVAGTEGGDQPFFSPDGRQLGFITLAAIARVPVAGGEPTVVCPVNSAATRGASWGSDDTIVFAQGVGTGLYRVKAAGGQAPEPFLRDVLADGETFSQPWLLPVGRALLYTILMPGGRTRVEARRLDGGPATVVAESGGGARYLPPGFVLYADGERLMAVRFDAATLRTLGSPAPVFEGVFTKQGYGVSNLATSNEGSAVFVAGRDAESSRRLIWVDRTGKRLGAAIDEFFDGTRNQRLSPDGRRVAVTVGSALGYGIWIYDLTGAEQPLKLTHGDHNTFANWSADGRRVYMAHYHPESRGPSVRSLPTDGSVLEPERVAADEIPGTPFAASPDGAYLILGTGSKLLLLPLRGGAATPWTGTPFRELGADFSPDGRFVAYSSDPSGRLEIYVRPFPGPGAPVRVSADGGHDPQWSRDGRELFFRQGDRLLAARVLSTTPGFRAEPPRVLFEGGFFSAPMNAGIRFYDVAPDGRFLMLEAQGASTASLLLVQNWAEELERLLR